jgi:PTH1 family peptidyl-tRNA hydrolase
MKLIFAQGNPGSEFKNSRHNVGFGVIDMLAAQHNAIWSEKSKFHALIAEFTTKGEKVILVKPLTFYNETGSSIRALVDFYKLPTEDILVIHDDLALPVGTVRVRSKGSDAGNNGIKNINAHIGEHYKRIRVGVWNELRDQIDDVDFVLGKFSKAESKALEDISHAAIDFIDHFIDGDLADHSVTLELA